MIVLIRFFFTRVLPSVLILAVVGCGDEKGEKNTGENAERMVPAGVAVPPVPKIYWSEVQVHQAVREVNPGYTGNGQFQIDDEGAVMAIGLDSCNVSALSFMSGMDLRVLDVSNCPVQDLSLVKGMGLVMLAAENTMVEDIAALAGNTTLQELYLAGTRVTNLAPLRGVPIQKLNLVNTHVKDLTPLAGMTIENVWLTGAPVEDISPLRSCRIVSLTLHKTKVRDLSPLSETGLQRLHIGETPVTDLSPLAGMNLTRLVFNRERIEKGLDAIEAMRSLAEIGSRFDDEKNDLAHPSVYWSTGAGKPAVN